METASNSLIIYITYRSNHVKYSLTYNGPVFTYDKVLSAFTKNDKMKFDRHLSKFNTSGNGCGNFILNGLSKDYSNELNTK